jgi:hypothetical protein
MLTKHQQQTADVQLTRRSDGDLALAAAAGARRVRGAARGHPRGNPRITTSLTRSIR